MDNRKQTQAFKKMVRSAAYADGADAAFEMLVGSGWTVPCGPDGACPPGFRIFATATWERRIMMRDSDGSFWALEITV